MKTVYKFQVVDGVLVVDLPASAKVIRFAKQGFSLFVWVELNSTEPGVRRVFRVVGTGMPIDDEEIHVGSCEAESFIWHLYEMPIDVMAANMEAEDAAKQVPG